MIKNRDQEIVTISYNHLHLPVKVTFQGGETMEYTYLADGTKVKKTAKNTQNTTTTTEYRGGFQYIDDVLEFFPTSEGYVKYNSNNLIDIYSYVFTYTDHLGNIRLKYTENPQTGELTILEEDHYYPYGLTHQGYQSNHQTIGFDGQVFTLIPVTPQAADSYKYKFNGMEWQDEFDVNMYDFGARNYDPALGRWMNIDPLAEMMRRHSPYNYAFNNPIFFIDPDGMMPTDSYGMKLSGAFESYDFTGSSSGFDVRTYDKATGKTLDFTTVSSLDNVSYDSQSGAISTNNSSAYQSFFQGVSDYAANADESLGGGDDCCGGNNINWNQVGKGAAAVLGGTLSTVGGVAGVVSGVAAPVGTAGIVFGIPTIGFGFANMIEGFRGGNPSLPSGPLEGIDVGFGGDGTVGQIGDVFSGGLPKNVASGLIMGYGLYNSNVVQYMINGSSGGSFSPISDYPLETQIDNTRVRKPLIFN